jgi:HEPN domain-containing protein
MCLNMVPPSIGIAAYHRQQSAEKLIKGMLVAAGVHFPKTHDLRALTDLAETHCPS